MTALNGAQGEALLASLRRMALVEPGEQPRLQALTGGVSSLIALAHTRDGPVCVKQALPKLLVKADWFAPVGRNRAEVAWMKFAATVDPNAVPRVLGEDAEGMAYAMAWLDPLAYPNWKTQLSEGLVRQAVAEQVGARLAAIHQASANDTTLAQRFANESTFRAIRLDPYLGAAALAHPTRADALLGLAHTTASTGLALVHGDVSPKNILAGPQGPVFLDAECACWADPAFDLAFCLNHLLLKCVWRPQRREALLGSFDALCRGYLARARWEPAEALEARAARLLPGLMLARIDGKSPVEYLSTPEQQEAVRRFALDALGRDLRSSTLQAVRTRWAEDTAP